VSVNRALKVIFIKDQLWLTISKGIVYLCVDLLRVRLFIAEPGDLNLFFLRKRRVFRYVDQLLYCFCAGVKNI
jgi:hypothetical protein